MFLENENELARKKNELYQVYIYEAKDNISVANTAVVSNHCSFSIFIYIDNQNDGDDDYLIILGFL